MIPTQAVTALILVDVQCGLLDGESAVPSSAAVLLALGRLLAMARDAGALVVHLQNDGLPGASDEPGQVGWELHPEVHPLESELVLRKTRDDGFDGTELEATLARHGVRQVAIGGLLSEMCVSATARGAMARGLTVVLVRGAHATYDLEEIPAAVVSRVAEHALGDAVVIAGLGDVRFSDWRAGERPSAYRGGAGA